MLKDFVTDEQLKSQLAAKVSADKLSELKKYVQKTVEKASGETSKLQGRLDIFQETISDKVLKLNEHTEDLQRKVQAIDEEL